MTDLLARAPPGSPRRWGIPGTGFLISVTLYLLLGYRASLAELGYADRPAALAWVPSVLWWPAQFHMFQEPRPQNTLVRAAAVFPHETTEVDLPALYPALREEGPSYARARFYSDVPRIARLAGDLCRRVPGEPRSVRIWIERWPKVPGEPGTRPAAPASAELGAWACSGPGTPGVPPGNHP